MGTHGATGARKRATSPARRSLILRLDDVPVARRLFAVIVAALLMGLIFGGLRVQAAEGSVSQLGGTEQLANLSAQLSNVVDDLQSERDATVVALLDRAKVPALTSMQEKTDRDVAGVQSALAPILHGGFPAIVEADAAKVNADLSTGSLGNITALHQFVNDAPSTADVITGYSAAIDDIIAFQDQVAVGVTDASLTEDVETSNELSLWQEQVAQEQVYLDEAFYGQSVADGLPPGYLDDETEQNLRVAYGDEQTDSLAFFTTASAAEQVMFDDKLGPNIPNVNDERLALNLEQDVLEDASTTPPVNAAGTGPLVPVGPDGIQLQTLLANQVSEPGVTTVGELANAWDTGMNVYLRAVRDTGNLVNATITTRAGQLRRSAEQTALTYALVTLAVLLIVMLAALLVARSLVDPLRRLRSGALNVATVQLPERVRLLFENPESAASMKVEPINVTSQDEVGQVARAFDQVHSEAVRLAGEQALLRSSFNAMFVNLSRRSQSLIERLARIIDTLEQNEDDPDRLANLFTMDHLVTRMRRNSENLLLLGGHENPRKWSESALLADVTRAAASEIEQYNRITLSIPAGVSVAGQAVSDVVHLLAELLENATIFSPNDTQVTVSAQEVSGGVLMEILDKGIGVSEARLADLNWRLDNPPTADVSVSRHMGLFAVARLAERHRVRVRLRPATPKGLSALVWLPGSVIEHGRHFDTVSAWSARPAGVQTAVSAGKLGARDGSVALAPGNGNGLGVGVPPRDSRSASGWFRSREGGEAPPSGAGASRTGAMPPWGNGRNPAEITADPVYTDQTSAGLPVRTPKANLIPGSPPGGRALPQRTPEQARNRLAGFQRGTRRAHGQEKRPGQPGQAARAGEGSER